MLKESEADSSSGTGPNHIMEMTEDCHCRFCVISLKVLSFIPSDFDVSLRCQDNVYRQILLC